MGRLTRRPRPAWVLAGLVAVAGIGAAVVVAADASMTGRETAELLGWAGGSALVGGAVTVSLLRALRRHALALQLAVLACAVVVVVLVGAWLGARAMFLSAHDLSALAVLLLAAGTVAAVTAVLLGDRLGRESAALVDATRRIAAGETVPVPGPGGTGELGRLAREVAEMSARLDKARRREQAVERSRRELVAWVSHDLRTPLAGIRAIAEALEDGFAADAPTLARYHSLLRVEAEQLAGLVDDLFELSRAQAGVLRLELERLSLGDLVSDAIAGVAPVAAAKGVRLEGRVDAPPPELAGSAPELLRALRNILENAVRHTPADGSVRVEAGRDGDGAYVAVRDDGGGVPEEDLPRVFDVGFRGDPARTPGQGAGLGLAIARSLVEAHRGRLSVVNESGGARFTMWLPTGGSAAASDDDVTVRP